MKASIGDVALKAGVSNATVSRTFAHPEQVSEATRIKVQAAADALNFSISRSARILKSGRTYRVALLIGSHAIEWFTAEIIAGLNDVLRDAGYDLVIYPIEGAEARDAFFEELPVRNNADAVFVSSFGISPDEVKHLGTAKIPIVGVNTTSEGFDATVGIDDKEGIKLIVRHLAKLGHRNLLYLYESFSSTLGFSSYNRITGFQEACGTIDGMNARTLAVQKNDNIIDAAISRQTLFNVTIPLMMPSITVCTFLTVTNGFKMFDQNLALTNGAPSNSSELLALNIYRTFYGRAGFEGVGQAKAVVFFIIVAVIALIQNKLTTSKEVQA